MSFRINLINDFVSSVFLFFCPPHWPTSQLLQSSSPRFGAKPWQPTYHPSERKVKALGFWVLDFYIFEPNKNHQSSLNKHFHMNHFRKINHFFFNFGTILFDNSTVSIRFPRRFFNVSKNDKYSKGSPFHVCDQLLYQRILHHKRTVCRSPAWRPRDGKTIPTNKEGEIWTENLWDLWQFMIYRLLWNSPQHQPITCCVTWWLKRTDNRAGKHGNCDEFINIHQTETQLSSFPGK